MKLKLIIIKKLIKIFNSIPINFQPAIITATATLTGAFLGATFAQLISHLLSNKRENLKNYKEVYQKLFAPVLIDIYSYLDICTHNRRTDDLKFDIDEDVILKKIICHIGNNLMFASPNIISNYNKVRISEFEEDFSGFIFKVNELNLIEIFLLDLYNCGDEVGFLNKDTKKQLIKYILYYKLWSFFTCFFCDFKKSSSLLRYKYYFYDRKLNYKNYKRIEKKLDLCKLKLSLSLKCINNKLLKAIFNKHIYIIMKKYQDSYLEICMKKMVQMVTKKVGREEIIITIKYEKERETIYNETSTYFRELLFLDVTQNCRNGQVEIKMKVRNISEEIHDIKIEDFKLVKFDEIRINHNYGNSYFIDKHFNNKFSYKLLPTEAIEILICFNLKEDNINDYYLTYINGNEIFSIEEIINNVVLNNA